MTNRIWMGLGAAAAIGLAACGSSSTSSGSPAPSQCTPPAKATTSFKQDVYPQFVSKCIACHGDNQTSRPKFASVDPEVAYSAARSDVSLVDPAQSKLVVLPAGNSGHPAALDPAGAATITKWIEECAQDD